MGILIDATARFEERRKTALIERINAHQAVARAAAGPMAATAKHIPSRYDGKCRSCFGAYVTGEIIAWTPGVKGAEHVACSTKDIHAAQA